MKEICTMTPVERVAAIEDALRPLADPAKALEMRAYLKGQFEFLGLAAPVRRQAVKALSLARMHQGDDLLGTARLLWAMPEREFKYTAVDLLRQQSRCLSPAHLPQIQQLMQQAPWWETVDSLSAVVGDVLHAARGQVDDPQRLMDAWVQDPDFWLRRCAMIHQLGWREDTDWSRLQAYALRLAPEKEFFIRKAIGWAFRDHARCRPDRVREFMHAHRAQFSGLTLREALKHV